MKSEVGNVLSGTLDLDWDTVPPHPRSPCLRPGPASVQPPACQKRRPFHKTNKTIKLLFSILTDYLQLFLVANSHKNSYL